MFFRLLTSSGSGGHVSCVIARNAETAILFTTGTFEHLWIDLMRNSGRLTGAAD